MYPETDRLNLNFEALLPKPGLRLTSRVEPRMQVKEGVVALALRRETGDVQRREGRNVLPLLNYVAISAH